MKKKQNRCPECVHYDSGRKYCDLLNLPTQELCFCKEFEMRQDLCIRLTQFQEWLEGHHYAASTINCYMRPIRRAASAGLTEEEVLAPDSDDLFLRIYGRGCAQRTRGAYRQSVARYKEFASSHN